MKHWGAASVKLWVDNTAGGVLYHVLTRRIACAIKTPVDPGNVLFDNDFSADSK